MSDFGHTLLARPSRARVLTSVVLVSALLALGMYAGLRLPWGAKHPRVMEGIAQRANDENDLVLFDSRDGTQFGFGADRVWWESGSSSGQGDPPCLTTPLDEARVEVGIVRVVGPTGGWHQQVAWVKCL